MTCRKFLSTIIRSLIWALCLQPFCLQAESTDDRIRNTPVGDVAQAWLRNMCRQRLVAFDDTQEESGASPCKIVPLAHNQGRDGGAAPLGWPANCEQPEYGARCVKIANKKINWAENQGLGDDWGHVDFDRLNDLGIGAQMFHCEGDGNGLADSIPACSMDGEMEAEDVGTSRVCDVVSRRSRNDTEICCDCVLAVTYESLFDIMTPLEEVIKHPGSNINISPINDQTMEQIQKCGNGQADPLEDCDWGGNQTGTYGFTSTDCVGGTACQNCRCSTCGNGKVDTGRPPNGQGEECDGDPEPCKGDSKQTFECKDCRCVLVSGLDPTSTASNSGDYYSAAPDFEPLSE